MAIATYPEAPAPQPIKALLAMRRITVRRLALEVTVPEIALGQIVNGRRRAPAELRRRLSEYLEVPEDQLFTVEARS